nr:MAG TPA: hypothetical protein [Crassvirales sp.]
MCSNSTPRLSTYEYTAGVRILAIYVFFSL